MQDATNVRVKGIAHRIGMPMIASEQFWHSDSIRRGRRACVGVWMYVPYRYGGRWDRTMGSDLAKITRNADLTDLQKSNRLADTSTGSNR